MPAPLPYDAAPADRWLARLAAAGLAAPGGAPVHAGSVLLQPRVDLVTAHETGHELDPRELLLPRLGRLQRAHRGADPWRTPLPPWGMRLARLLRQARQVLPDDGRRLSFADDGRRCWVTAVEA